MRGRFEVPEALAQGEAQHGVDLAAVDTALDEPGVGPAASEAG